MHRRTLLPILSCALLSCALLPAASAAEWVELFDGQTLDGWEQRNGHATYEVRDGAIVGTTAEGSVNSFLCTKKHYGDFELEFDVKVSDELNSGIMIRAAGKPTTTGKGNNNAAGRVYGPQVEIEASREDGAEAGYVYGEATGRGWLTPPERLIPHKKFRDGEWNHFRVVAKGPRIQTWINGEMVEDITDEPIYKTHPSGFLGLQVHGIKPGTGPYQAAWKNIRIKELD